MSDDNNDMIPRARLNDKINELNKANDRLAELEKELTETKKSVDSFKALSAQADNYKKELDELKAKHESAISTWEQDKIMLSSGVSDSDVRDLMRHKFSGLKEEKPFEDWFKAQVEDPSAILRPFVTKPDPQVGNDDKTPQEGAETPQKKNTKNLPGNQGAEDTPASNGPLDFKAIAKMDDKTWSEMKGKLLKGEF